jgi:hypothetical protein
MPISLLIMLMTLYVLASNDNVRSYGNHLTIRHDTPRGVDSPGSGFLMPMTASEKQVRSKKIRARLPLLLSSIYLEIRASQLQQLTVW